MQYSDVAENLKQVHILQNSFETEWKPTNSHNCLFGPPEPIGEASDSA